MPIRPTYSQKGSDAKRIFVGREMELTEFKNYLQSTQTQDSYCVTSWYGVGGQGKTALSREFQKIVQGDKEVGKRIAFARLDFENPKHRNIEDATLSLRLQLAQGTGLRFPAFDTAYARYFSLDNPGVRLRERHPELFRGENELLGDLLDWSESGISEVAGEIVQAAGQLIPGLNVLYKYGSRLTGATRAWWERRGKHVLEGLDELRADQLRQKLPTYLGADISDALDRDGAFRFVIIIDTYEALWRANGGKDAFGDSRVDTWVRLLVQESPGVLFVILGREKLSWGKSDPAWRGVVNEYRLSNLSDRDSDRFLRAASVDDFQIRDRIVNNAGGLPFVLNLQVDLFVAIKASGSELEPSLFGGTHPETLARFLDHLPNHHGTALRLASYPRTLDIDVLGFLGERFLGGAYSADWQFLLSQSFMSASEDQPTNMHSVMREELQRIEANTQRSLFELVHTALAKWFAARFQSPNTQQHPWMDHHLLEESKYHFRQGSGYEQNEQYLSVVKQLGQVYQSVGYYSASVKEHEELLTILGQIMDESSDQFVEALDGLAVDYAALAMHKEAFDLLNRLLSCTSNRMGMNHPDTACVLSRLASETSYLGRHKKAEHLYWRALCIIEDTLGSQHPTYASTLSGLAHLYSRIERYEQADGLMVRVLAIYDRVYGKGSERYNFTRNWLAEIRVNRNHFEEAEGLYLDVVKYYESLDCAPVNTHSMALHNLAKTQLSLGKLQEAERNIDKALAVEGASRAATYPYIGEYRVTLGHLYVRMERYKEALDNYQAALDVFLGPLGRQEDVHAVRAAIDKLRKEMIKGAFD